MRIGNKWVCNKTSRFVEWYAPEEPSSEAPVETENGRNLQKAGGLLAVISCNLLCISPTAGSFAHSQQKPSRYHENNSCTTGSNHLVNCFINTFFWIVQVHSCLCDATLSFSLIMVTQFCWLSKYVSEVPVCTVWYWDSFCWECASEAVVGETRLILEFCHLHSKQKYQFDGHIVVSLWLQYGVAYTHALLLS